MPDFQLIETMRVSESGRVYLLERHLHRLSRSARYFSFKCDLPKVRDEILGAIPGNATPFCLRLTLAKEGLLTLQSSPLPVGHSKRLILSSVRVHSNDVFLYHKTTNRGVYEQARKECDDETDAILINERGELTETAITNIAVFRGSHWMTPQVSCGLLPGTMREELLAQGEIIEGVIRSDEIHAGQLIRCFNALRGTGDIPVFHPEGVSGN